MFVLPSPSFAIAPVLSPQVQTLKYRGHWVASKSNLQHIGHRRCGKHLVAIYCQSSPSTPAQGHSRIDTGPEEKYNNVKLKSENVTITEIFLPL